jgi:hypothetical protein
MDRTIRKNYIMLFAMCMVIFSVLIAGTDEELFLRGNNYYEQKDYDNAFRSYDMISKKGRAVLYNMGNVCFYKQDYAQALVYWSRAQIGATQQEYKRIEHNKEHVFMIIGKTEEQSFALKIIKLLRAIMPYVSLFFLQIFFLLCWYLLFLIARKQQIKIKKCIMSCVCFFMIVAGALLGVHYVNQCTQNGIIIKKEGRLFSAPDTSFHELCSLKYAYDVTIQETRQGWYKIKYADMIGWVEADMIQVI